MKNLDVSTLDPGIRDVVVALRAAGFGTFDSGDGSKRGEGTLPFPHVAIVESIDNVDVADTVNAILDVVKRTDKRDGWIVDAGYSTADGVLTFVASLPPSPTEHDRAILLISEQLDADVRRCLERAQCQGHHECNPVETHNGCNARAILARFDAVGR